jgi:hypothetical protein
LNWGGGGGTTKCFKKPSHKFMFGNGDLCRGVNGNKGVVYQLGCNPQLNLFSVVLGGETLLEHGNIDNSSLSTITCQGVWFTRGGPLSNMFYMDWNKVKGVWKKTNVFLWLMKHGKANSFHASIWLCWVMEKWLVRRCIREVMLSNTLLLPLVKYML